MTRVKVIRTADKAALDAAIAKSALDAAIAKSALARMSATAREQIVSRGTRVTVRSKAYFIHHQDAPRVGVVVTGLFRSVRSHSDGRELTLLFAGPGETLGLTTTVIAPAPSSFQAVTDSVLLELSGAQIRDLAKTDPTVGWALAEFATALLRRAIDELVLYAYGDLRTRIERRLLEIALRMPPGTPLVAHITQADLAESVGAARPSVARVLKDLRDEGSISPLYGGVMLLRPEALAKGTSHALQASQG